MSETPKPIRRSRLRLCLGTAYYSFLRKLLWLKKRNLFAKTMAQAPLPYSYFPTKPFYCAN